jgi:hypothetical protein
LLFERFLRTISSLFPVDLASTHEAIAKLNPEKIYVENVRSLLDVSTWRARQICETAVRQGVFERRVEVMCPDGAVAASAATESELPETVRCWAETPDGFEESWVQTALLPKQPFYRLVDDGADAARPYPRTA